MSTIDVGMRLGHTRTHTLAQAAHSRKHTHPHTLSGSRDPKLGSRGSCLRLHGSGHLDSPVVNAVPALARNATRQARAPGPQAPQPLLIRDPDPLES